MKHLLFFFLVASVILNLSGCGLSNQEENEPTFLVQIREPTEENTIPQTEKESETTDSPTMPTEIPEESNMPREPDDEDFVRIIDYIPTARVELAELAGCTIAVMLNLYNNVFILASLVKSTLHPEHP